MSYVIITRCYDTKTEGISSYSTRKQAAPVFSDEVNDSFPTMRPMTEDDGDLPWIIRVGSFEIIYDRILVFRDLPVYFEGKSISRYSLPECCSVPFLNDGWRRRIQVGGYWIPILGRSVASVLLPRLSISYEMHLSSADQLEILNRT